MERPEPSPVALLDHHERGTVKAIYEAAGDDADHAAVPCSGADHAL